MQALDPQFGSEGRKELSLEAETNRQLMLLYRAADDPALAAMRERKRAPKQKAGVGAGNEIGSGSGAMWWCFPSNKIAPPTTTKAVAGRGADVREMMARSSIEGELGGSDARCPP
jgi:hypothetical protein